MQNPSEKALLIGVYFSRREAAEQKLALEELKELARTAGAEILAAELFELRDCSPATFLGKGRIEMLKERIVQDGCNVLIFDDELSPTQNRNLEKALEVKVIDRTRLILDIFAKRARTSEGKLQVELAQLRYLATRLSGRGGEFSQLAGGIGTRGPGETRLEMDRRKIKERISFLQKELEHVRTHRELHRNRRAGAPIPLVALVGYTNAGKSTLMNRLTKADVFVENRLFATLDPTVRRLKLPSGREVLLADTVGFIHKLPHPLVKAFRATFEEVEAADLLIHLVDISHPDAPRHIQVVEEVLDDLKLIRKPALLVFNKIDRELIAASDFEDADVRISALTGEGIPTLLQAIEKELSLHFRFLQIILPYDAGSVLSRLYRAGRILERKDLSDGIHLKVEVDEKEFRLYRKYQVA